MNIVTLADILTFPVTTLAPDRRLNQALTLMRERGISALVVVEGDRPIGIFTERDAVLSAYRHDSTTTIAIADVMGCPPLTARHDMDYRDAYRLIAERGVRHLIVVDVRGRLAGIVTQADFLEHLGPEYLVRYKEVGSVMTRTVVTLPFEATMEDAVRLMARQRLSCIVVEHEALPVGMLTERDIVRLSEADVDPVKTPLPAVMSQPVKSVVADQALPDTVRLMDESGIRRLVVVSEGGGIVGVVTRHDIVKKLHSRHLEMLREREKELEEARAQIQEHDELRLLRSLIDQSGDAVMAVNAVDGCLIFVNEQACRDLGYRREELLGRPISEIGAWYRDESWPEWIAELRKRGRMLVETEYRRRDGRVLQVEVNLCYLSLEGGDYVVGSIRDITERKLTEEALRRNEETYRGFFEQAPLPYQSLDENGNFLAANAAWRKTLGYESGEVLGKSFADFLADGYQDHFRKNFPRFKAAGEVRGVQLQTVRKDKQAIDVEFEGKAAKDSGGGCVHTHCVLTDVTDRAKHEAFTTHHTRRTEALLELPRLAEELDETAFMQRGLETAEDLTESLISFLHFVNEDEQSIELVTWSRRTLEQYCSATTDLHYPVREAGIWADALRRYEAVVFNDYPGYAHKRGLPEGHAGLTRLISLPVLENGKVVMLAGVGNKSTDYNDLDVETLQLIADAIWRIVQRRRGVIRLQANEARYRELVENMTDGVTVHEAVDSGRDFVIYEHNRAGEQITGMKRDRAIGRRITEAFPNIEALGLLDVFRRVWRTGQAESYPTSLYKDERISRWVECYVFKLPGGEIVNVYSDMTERKQAEEKLLKSRERLRHLAARIEATREEERSAIAREVHDELGQALTGLKMDLAWLRDHLAEARTEPFTERLGAAEALADSTLDGMRRLAARLRPSLLDDLGLTAAIEWQVKELADRFGCKFDLDLTDDDIGLDWQRDTAVYRILQEALTNVARHAQASRVTVGLRVVGDTLELIVADNGKGIRDADTESVTSMGITGMRERAGALGGQVDIGPRPGGGTQVLLRMPARTDRGEPTVGSTSALPGSA